MVKRSVGAGRHVMSLASEFLLDLEVPGAGDRRGRSDEIFDELEMRAVRQVLADDADGRPALRVLVVQRCVDAHVIIHLRGRSR